MVQTGHRWRRGHEDGPRVVRIALRKESLLLVLRGKGIVRIVSGVHLWDIRER
jgi:hypothetical protein